ncbi:MAG: hypothetical protein OEZ06_23650 [Myxococcales bacterium]|nr:hypothetical protein [Myxococcales bacterium]
MDHSSTPQARAHGTDPVPASVPDAFLEELRGFPARHLRDLPVPVRFTLEATGINRKIACMTARLASTEEPLQGIFFDGEELAAISAGVEAERLSAAELRGFCLCKIQDPWFRVTRDLALDGAREIASRPRPLGFILDCLGLTLLQAELLGRPSAPPQRPADADTQAA